MAGLSLRKRLLVGNWKMYGSLQSNAQLLAELKQQTGNQACELVVCAPYVYLPQLAATLADSAIAFGAQDCSQYTQGAYTGEVSPAMLTDIGCTWVILGHSERRQYHAESNALIMSKLRAALDAGLSPILCVGETLQQREQGQTHQVVEQQLAGLQAFNNDDLQRIVIAYEPVWAIGTGLSASPEQAQEVHVSIRSLMPAAIAQQLKILYGGSVKADNAAQLFAMPDIDGALVGGASLNAQEFLHIAAA